MNKAIPVKRFLTVFITLILSIIGLSSTVEGQRRRQSRRDPPPCVRTLADCDDDGCRGDPQLNLKKNITDDTTDPEQFTLARIIALDRRTPRFRRADRSPLEEVGEGKAVQVEGYLIDAFMTRRPESTNCFLRGEENNDFHLNLTPRKRDGKVASVVAEITPRLRRNGWSLSKLQALATRKNYVKVTGWLLYDSAHTGASSSRATAWEVHPVSKFEVCTSRRVSDCQAGRGWRKLEDVQ